MSSFLPKRAIVSRMANRPGTCAVSGQTPFGLLSLTICYDLRFRCLDRSLAPAGADILTAPSAFSPVTGAAHWTALFQERAFETWCYVSALVQTGSHAAKLGKPRQAHHGSMAISPWKEILYNAGAQCSISYMNLDLDLDQVSFAHSWDPSSHDSRKFEGL